ncbi:MAG: S-adenosylmethionine:tRNA ribosyltransferase-isomerase [Nocardioidaceae bacterium]|nr:S-adenosylmethionine:tRNA ribosyltransferase-isomerase [Nocardioidaceae bacterium]
MEQFVVPPGSHAAEPPEQRGLQRDEVRLLVTTPRGVVHRQFRDLPDLLAEGDLVVVNTSATLPAALRVVRASDSRARMHVAGQRDDGSWVVELRSSDNRGPADDVAVGERVALPGGARLCVRSSYPLPGQRKSRLWLATPDRTIDRVSFLHEHGEPIRYGYLSSSWPLTALQTVYADEPGSAEMPSAGRPFTDRVLIRLMVRGVTVAPLVLHTGVSSPEKHEPPVAEWLHVPSATARLVKQTKEAGGRVVAVGTTVVRALESAADSAESIRATEGWTDLVLSPNRPAMVVDALITGLHEPESSHLQLLEAVAGRALVRAGYAAALREGYLWHEFGDSMLLLPSPKVTAPREI